LEIIYSLELLRSLSAIIRDVKPNVVLTIRAGLYGGPYQYMPVGRDGAFARGMSNFKMSLKALRRL